MPKEDRLRKCTHVGRVLILGLEHRLCGIDLDGDMGIFMKKKFTIMSFKHLTHIVRDPYLEPSSPQNKNY